MRTFPATLLRPATSDQVSDLLGEATALAGGTDLLVQRRAGREVDTLVDLSGLPDVPAAVSATDGEGGPALLLSALAPLSALAAGLGDRFGSLTDAIAVFASEQIRNRATLGGNLATGSPAADTVPPLLAAGARVVLRHGRDRRTVSVADFLLGPRRVDLAAGEWIELLEVPTPPPTSGFRKVGGRLSLAISFVNLAWQWHVVDGHLHDVRLAMGSVAPTVVRLTAAERVLAGAPATPDPELITAAAAAVAADISPIDDLRASAAYRRRAAGGLLRELLLGAEHRAAPRGQEKENPT